MYLNLIVNKLLRLKIKTSLFQSVRYFVFQIEEFNLIQLLTIIKEPVKEIDKNISNQSRNFDVLKKHALVGLIQFINIHNINQIDILLDDSICEKIHELAIK